MQSEYDVIIVGAGHAGCEAALASAKMGCRTLLLTMNLDSIALMPCNPAIGGLAKGHIVREIDALGGVMGSCIDKTGIQFRMLNTSKGPAVQALRAQADKQLYRLEMKTLIEKQNGLDVKQGIVNEIETENNAVTGVKISIGAVYKGKTVILTPGTFLNGVIHVGLESFAAGRAGEFPAKDLSGSLKKMGFELGRLKTGTCPRLDAKTIDFSILEEQKGDIPPLPFSHFQKFKPIKQVSCYITYTNNNTHKIITENLKRSPLYTGKIKGTGPRYCPSIEDKVMRFPEKERHQIFLEPEGLKTQEIYANGISTSLPLDIQLKFLRTISGLENVEIMRPGYAVEYDFVLPTQLFPTLETKKIKNLFHAGQINGTSGYEEAAAQGLIAGINAALKVKEKDESLVLKRSEAYIGILIDDLVTKGTEEPYRMFTSRAEYRLLLRHDNADMRLMKMGHNLGLVSKKIFSNFQDKKNQVIDKISHLKNKVITPSRVINNELEKYETGTIDTPTSLAELIRRPHVKYEQIKLLDDQPITDANIIKQIEIEIKYEGYINRQILQVKKTKGLEDKKLSENINYKKVPGLSSEVREKLSSIKPLSIGQASRISGVTPAAISVILIYLEKLKRDAKEGNKPNCST